MKPQKRWTVLDVGAGPGTLSLPLARVVKKVTAIDFSEKMLRLLDIQAKQENFQNVYTINAAWEDDWDDIGLKPHDIAIASRSLSVDDLKSALTKLDMWATERVFISDMVAPGPFDPDVFAAIGREFTPGPDYIYTLNILYQMGIHANVDFIELDRSTIFTTLQEAYDSLAWMVDDMTPKEISKLKAYIDKSTVHLADDTWRLTRTSKVKWAVLHWKK